MSESRTKRVGADHRRDPGRKTVVVAEADLRRGDGVVLVDHRHGIELQQGGEGRARVEMAPALLGVIERQQNLGAGDAVARQRLLIGVGQADLTRGGGGLLLFQAQHTGIEAEAAGGRPRWRPRRPARPRCRLCGAPRRRRRALPATCGGCRRSRHRPGARSRSSPPRVCRGEGAFSRVLLRRRSVIAPPSPLSAVIPELVRDPRLCCATPKAWIPGA